MTNLSDCKILIRGAGEMASGVAVCLIHSGFKVVMTEIAEPLCVRRAVSFCEAIRHDRMKVEGLEAVLVRSPSDVFPAWDQGLTAVLIDPEMICLPVIRPDVLVEATLAKRNMGLRRDMAELVIALGPGFSAGRDADIVVETNRGHNLGRLMTQGEAEPNTGRPGVIHGEDLRRVLRAPTDGVLETDLEIGVSVQAGQAVARVADRPIHSELQGVLRGLIQPGIKVWSGLKVGDIDPRGRPDFVTTVSDKARAIGGAVLTAILHHWNR